MECCRCDTKIEKIPYLIVGDFSACPKCMHEFEVLVQLSLDNPNVFKEVIHKWKTDIKARKNIMDIRHLNITIGEYTDLTAEYYRTIGRNDKIIKYRNVYLSIRQVGHYLQTIKDKSNDLEEIQLLHTFD